MSETLPVIDMPVNIDMDVNKGKMLLEILQNAAKFNHGFSFGAGGLGGVPASPATPGVPSGTFNPGAIPGAGSTGNGRGIASRAGNAMLNTVIAPFILLGKTTTLTTKSVKVFGTALKKTTGVLQGIFTSVLKWSLGLTAVAGGGMFGYSRLAKGVSNDLNASRGLGVSTAFNKAFNTVWGNKLDGAGEFLNAVSMAKGDPGSEGAKTLLGLGINPNGDEQANTMAALRSAWAYARQHKDSSSGKRQFDVLYGGLKLGGTGFNQLGRMDEEEFNKNADMLAKQTKNNEISERTQRSYQDIMIQLEGNMNSLGTTFVKMLQDLNPQILDFSNAITRNLNEFMMGNGKDLFTEVGDGLKNFTKYISSPEFKSDVKYFTEGIGKFAKGIRNGLVLLGIIRPEDDGEKSEIIENLRKESSFNVNGGQERNGGITGFLRAIGNTSLGLLTGGRVSLDSIEERWKSEGWANYQNGKQSAGIQTISEPEIKSFVERVNDSLSLPNNMMSAVAEIESSWNPMAVNPKTGARGVWQFIEETAKAYNLSWDDAFDPIKSTHIAGKYLTDNLRRYDGDIAKTLAQYNGGNKAVQGNKLNVKLETINYLLKALELIPDMSKQHAGLRDKLIVARNKVGNSGGRVEIDLNINSAPGSDINVQTTSTLATASAMRFNGIPK
ncbi:transglycosylase SLT domain-containing protein [Enterobacter kobei]|nr:transglycosylase SLT domain-containing protein [Enterobacter kobei]